VLRLSVEGARAIGGALDGLLPLLWIAAAYVGFRLLLFAVLINSFSRARLLVHRFSVMAPEERPPALAPLFEGAAQILAARGFESAGYAWLSPVLLGGESTPVLVLTHAASGSTAWLAPHAVPCAAAPLGLTLSSVFDDGRSITTLSGKALDVLFDDPGGRVIDRFRVRLSEQIDDHFAALAERGGQARVLDLEGWFAQQRASLDAGFRTFCVASADGSYYRLRFAHVLKVARRALSLLASTQKLSRERLTAPAEYEVPGESLQAVEEWALALIECHRVAPPRRAFVWGVFALTMLLFAGSLLLTGAADWVLNTTLIVLVHEIGHFLAMRATGYHQPTIFFVPFLGAATVGRKHNTTLWGELFVLAAGPVPGLVLAAAALLWVPDLSPALSELAKLSLIINGANLLPLWPLDGGKIAQLFFAKERPLLEAALGGISGLGFAALALEVMDGGLFALAFITLFGAHASYRVARLTRTARDLKDPPSLALRALAATRAPRATFPQRAALVTRIVERLSHAPGTFWQRALASSIYAGALLLTLTAFSLATPGRLPAPTLVLECDQLPEAGPAFSSRDLVGAHVRCFPSSDATLADLEHELKELSDLPAGLRLRKPFGSAADLSARELHARGFVRELERTWRASAVLADAEDDDDKAWQLARAGALKAVEAQVSSLRSDPDFDRETAEAYLLYRTSDGDHGAAQLEALLGRASNERDALGVAYASVAKDGRTLSTMAHGDVDGLAHHMCERACQKVEVTSFARRHR
jgi:Zn-dependent protease